MLLAHLGAARKGDRQSTEQPRPGSHLTLNIKDFHPVGDGKTDDTESFTGALDRLRDGGGTLIVPPGTYVVGDLKVGSGTVLRGNGPNAFPVLLKALKAKSIIELSSRALPNSTAQLHDITIEYLTLRGRSLEDGFSEHIHNINVMGIDKLTISHVRFESFQGDGLYLGTRVRGDNVLHNSEVNVSDSTFDGADFENRNGISVIDCSRCLFDRNEFANLSRSDMPGAIDLEPNQPVEIIRDVSLRNNVVTSSRGAGIAVVIRPEGFHQSPSRILIENNRIQNTAKGILVLWKGNESGPKTSPARVVIRRNQITNADQALILDGAAGFIADENDISVSRQGVQLGAHFGISNMHIGRNRLAHLGVDSGHGIMLFGPVTAVIFEGNSFEDLGSQESDGSAIYFARGSAKDVKFVGNTFSSPGHQTRIAIGSASLVAFTPDSIAWASNILKDGVTAGTFPHRP